MNQRKLKIAVVIPAYNEEATILSVIQSIQDLNPNAQACYVPIVINDCSQDQTAVLIDKANCTAIHLSINLGIGGAVQTGFRFAFDQQFDYAIQIDGDGQHPSYIIPNMLEDIKKKDLDVIIGSRFLTHTGFQSTLARRMGIRYFYFINKYLVNIKIKDSTSGMRLLNRNALQVVCDYYPDEYPEPESLIVFAHHKLKIGEYPVPMKERQGGVSSIDEFSSIYYIVKVSLAIFFTYLRLKSENKDA